MKILRTDRKDNKGDLNIKTKRNSLKAETHKNKEQNNKELNGEKLGNKAKQGRMPTTENSKVGRDTWQEK